MEKCKDNVYNKIDLFGGFRIKLIKPAKVWMQKIVQCLELDVYIVHCMYYNSSFHGYEFWCDTK